MAVGNFLMEDLSEISDHKVDVSEYIRSGFLARCLGQSRSYINIVDVFSFDM